MKPEMILRCASAPYSVRHKSAASHPCAVISASSSSNIACVKTSPTGTSAAPGSSMKFWTSCMSWSYAGSGWVNQYSNGLLFTAAMFHVTIFSADVLRDCSILPIAVSGSPGRSRIICETTAVMAFSTPCSERYLRAASSSDDMTRALAVAQVRSLRWGSPLWCDDASRSTQTWKVSSRNGIFHSSFTPPLL